MITPAGEGCDCSGWDMACPIVVFGHSHADDWIYQSDWEVQKAMLPFVEGSKKMMLALTNHGRC
ncbi:unnamed protein product [Musa acuminata subsp. burmannicoides]